ncbi:MAG: hypothetical protein ACRDNF_15105 [Streptosporangiaceae bacterium]
MYKPHKLVVLSASVAGLALTASAFTAPAFAANSTALYAYSFNGIGAGDTVMDTVTAGPYAPINLPATADPPSNLTPSGDGSQFLGGTTTGDSVAGEKPAAKQDSLDESGSDYVGTETEMVFNTPDNPGCTAADDDTPNVSQIGRFNAGQIKLQESNCSGSVTTTYMECRIASQKTQGPIKNMKLALIGGDEYQVTCIKSPDHSGAGTNQATIMLRVKDITTHQSAFTLTTTEPDTGNIVTSGAVSVGNKYPVATASNTDQFNGVVNANDYCDSTVSLSAVETCLTNNL